MASNAFAGRPPVNHYISAVNLLVVGMTELAGNLIVSAGERKCAGGLVIEKAGRPANGVVAQSAIDGLRPFLKLSRVNILVAADATFRRRLEWNSSEARHGSNCCNRPVAIDTGEDLMTANQRKRRVRVIE